MERYQPDQYGRMMLDAHGQWVSLRAAEITALDAAQKSSADAQATVEALQRERDGLEAKCLEEHVTIEQADAKVMKLEGDKGMWANERRDLLTQLENAESQLSQLRALVREIKKEFDNCTHECERCGESDPLTTFDIYRTVAKAATLDATTPAGGQG